jgi:hypothetical protein
MIPLKIRSLDVADIDKFIETLQYRWRSCIRGCTRTSTVWMIPRILIYPLFPPVVSKKRYNGIASRLTSALGLSVILVYQSYSLPSSCNISHTDVDHHTTYQPHVGLTSPDSTHLDFPLVTSITGASDCFCCIGNTSSRSPHRINVSPRG